MLTCQFVCCLAEVDWDEAALFPKLKQLLCDSKWSTEVVKRRWSSLRKGLEDRWHLLCIFWFYLFFVDSFLWCFCWSCRMIHFLLFVSFNVVVIGKLTLVIFQQKFKCSWAIASTACVWMGGNSNNPDTAQACKTIILKLFRNSPWDQITRWSEPSLEMILYWLLIYRSFKTYLHSTKNIGQARLAIGHGSKKDEDLMGWCVRQKLQVVWAVLVVWSHENVHYLLEETFCRWMIRE